MEPVAEPIAEAAEPVAEVSVPWVIAPSTWMFPSRAGVLNAFLDSLPATGTVAVDRVPRAQRALFAESSAEASAETVVSADEPVAELFQRWLRTTEVTETSAEPVADTYAEPAEAPRPPPAEASASAAEPELAFFNSLFDHIRRIAAAASPPPSASP